MSIIQYRELSIEEINEKFDSKWVYLSNLKNGEYGKVIGGDIVAHNENREKVIQTMLSDSDGDVYIFYAGKVPEGVSLLL